MSRSVAWRHAVSDAANWHQDEALNATIYILREIGPTGFLLKEEGETKTFKVLLGDPHTCTCQVFRKEKDLCKHLCWVLLKKLRVPRTNPVIWQLGLVEREINEILRGITAQQKDSAAARRLAREAAQTEESGSGEQDGGIKQREISQDDVCPICQEELLEQRLPVTYCKFGCGNNIHIKCMKVWAEHQKTQGAQVIKCPMCREDFGPLSLLQQEFRNSSVRETRAAAVGEHLGTTCKKCHMCPISGKCYRCSICADYHLCQACFNTPTHADHPFEFRQKANQRWRPAQRGQGQVLPEAIVHNLMSRDITEHDYDLLLQLDSENSQPLSDLTEETVRSFPLERVRTNSALLQPGQQCRVCLRPYQEGQYTRRLPCRHKFHKECIDNWLLHQHATCPVDGTIYTNESVRQIQRASRIRQQQTGTASGSTPHGHVHRSNAAPDPDLQIPGLGIARLGNSQVLDRHMNGILEISGINSGAQSHHGQRRTITPPELPNPYVYTTSGEYINFTDNPGDIRLIHNAAERMRCQTNSDTRVSGPVGYNRENSAPSLARTSGFDNTPIHLYPNAHNIQTNTNEHASHLGNSAIPRQREGGLDFSNLLLADVRRNSVGNHSNADVNRVRSNRSANQNAKNSEHNQRSRRNSERSSHLRSGNHSTQNGTQYSGSEPVAPTVNLTLGSITNAAGTIGLANREHRVTDTTSADNISEQMARMRRRYDEQRAERSATRRRQFSGESESAAQQLDVSGQSYAHTNGENSAAKPPSGADNRGRSRGGRLRSRAPYGSTRPRAHSRDRSAPLHSTEAQPEAKPENGLYVGNEPDQHYIDIRSDVITDRMPHAQPNKLRKPSVHAPVGCPDPRYLWGQSRHLSAEEMMLSGTSCNNGEPN